MRQATSDEGAVPVREGEEVSRRILPIEPAAFIKGDLHLVPKLAKSIEARLGHVDLMSWEDWESVVSSGERKETKRKVSRIERLEPRKI